MQDITYQTASEIRDAIRRRAVTAGEVVEAHFDRIRRCNPALNAIVTLDEEGAR